MLLWPTLLPSASLPAIVPTQVLNLIGWNLGVPTNTSGELFYDPPANTARSTARDIRPVGSYVSPYFYAGYAPDGTPEVNMIAPVFGSTTTPGVGSDGTRCEFRSLLQGSGADSTCFRAANLPRIQGKMRAVQTPTATGDVDICQIQPNVFFILMLRENGQIESKVQLFAGGTQTPLTYVASGVRIGDVIGFDVTLNGPLNRLEIGISINGGVWQWTNQPIDPQYNTLTNMYFKAGAYHTADPNQSADFPKVVAGLLNPAEVTDVAWVAYRELTVSLGA